MSKFTPKLMLPALSIGIFLENFFIKFSSFLEKPVVPITNPVLLATAASVKLNRAIGGSAKITAL